jgi:Transmembrane exosortase (Exosortase_EpsH).
MPAQRAGSTIDATAAIFPKANTFFSQEPLAVIITLLVLFVLLLFSYLTTIPDLLKTWMNVVDYHHGFFVVPFVIYFLWSRRNTLPTQKSKADAIAGIVLGSTLLLFWGVFRYQVLVYSMVTLDSWTILIWVWAVTLICFGLRVFLWALPSLLFLAFMFPWPPTIEGEMREPLQGFAAKLSVYFLRLLGEPAIAQGNTVLMSNNQQLEVEAACSGIRVLVSAIAAAYATMLLMRRSWWQNVLLFCLVIPVALLVNALRIAMTGMLIKHASGIVGSFGSKKPTPVVCDEISGGIMLVLTFVFFIAIVWWIGKVFPRVELTEEHTRVDHL